MKWLSRLSASTQFFPNIVLPMMLLDFEIGVAFIKTDRHFGSRCPAA
jgi:hypothetical protein